ncbi:DUF1343 domain-containing protein [Pseudoflavitalea sp. G-6-1-2]|nr:DUF1343 domain-containing protein [Pseudoflavitalea sp. G-6-1-2]
MKMKSMQKTVVILLMAMTAATGSFARQNQYRKIKSAAEQIRDIHPAADRSDLYLPLLKGKRIAVFANHTSTIGTQNLVDSLHKLGVDIKVVFGPEHGFRGTADAGEKVGNYTDAATGIPVVSLYGSKRRPSKEDLRGVDLMLFDIQDVGTRFYTYISSLEEYMAAAFENKIPLIILDRPNPNGFYVDGPVLDTTYRSFVGMQRVPIVYGMTIGEYARMVAGEKWIKEASVRGGVVTEILDTWHDLGMITKKATPYRMIIVPCNGYDHSKKYVLPVKPSPNLPDIQSIYCYPSTCFFEGTVLSEGRGTPKPFQLFGHPSLPNSLQSFTPRGVPGATNPKLKDQLCYGWEINGTPGEVLHQIDGKIQLKWLLEAYKLFPKKDSFFLTNGSFFNKLAGNSQLQQQIKEGKTEAEIRASWEPALSRFKTIRKKYLIYADF